jgi:hypothetical protein
LGIESGQEPVEDLLAADLALVGGIVALALEGGPALECVWNKVHDSQIESKWQSSPTGRAQ